MRRAKQAPSAAVMGINYLSRTAFPAAVVWSREYRERVPLSASTPEAPAQAWNERRGGVPAALARDRSNVALTPP